MTKDLFQGCWGWLLKFFFSIPIYLVPNPWTGCTSSFHFSLALPYIEKKIILITKHVLYNSLVRIFYLVLSFKKKEKRKKK